MRHFKFGLVEKIKVNKEGDSNVGKETSKLSATISKRILDRGKLSKITKATR